VLVRVAAPVLIPLLMVTALAQSVGSEPELLAYSITGWTSSESPAENAT
jgi:hypothetical protein